MFTSATSVAKGIVLDNGTVAGINASSSTVSFNVQGAGTQNPFNVSNNSGTSLMTVLANGKVGIGNTPGATLDIQKPASGNAFAISNASSGDTYAINNGGTTLVQNLQYGNVLFPGSYDGLDITAKTAGPGIVRLYPNGNSFSSLEFYSSYVNSGNLSRMRWDANLTHPGGYTFISEQGGSGVVGPVFFRMGSTDILAMLTNGNIGIGTNSPSANLYVMGTAGSAQYPFIVASSTGAGLLQVDSTGNVTVGGSLNLPSQVNFTSNVYTQFQATQSGVAFDFKTNNGNIVFTIGSSDALTITSGYKAGFNTTTPETDLQIVSSTANATSTLEIGSPASTGAGCVKMKSANGTVYYLTVTNAGALQVSASTCKSGI